MHNNNYLHFYAVILKVEELIKEDNILQCIVSHSLNINK